MRRIALLSLFTAIALILSLVDSALPPLLPVPGVRLGLANVVTLILLFAVRSRDAFLVLILRIILASVFAGQGMSFLYSLVGGLLCFLVIYLLGRLLRHSFVILVSMCGALTHNVGQLLVALWITQAPLILSYAPILVLSALLTGAFTGLCAMFSLRYLKPLFKSYGDFPKTF